MQTTEYANYLASIIDAQVYTSLVLSLKKILDKPKDRFDKADIIEQTLESASDDKLKWVDGIGRDHVDTINNFDLEFKYKANSLFTATGKTKGNCQSKN
jgi:hypothetical protein